MVRHTRGACGPGSGARGQLCQERREEVFWNGVSTVSVSCWPLLYCFLLRQLLAFPRIAILLQGSNCRWFDGLRRRLVCPADHRLSPKQPRRKLVCPADHLRIPKLPSRQKRNSTRSPMSAMRKRWRTRGRDTLCTLFRIFSARCFCSSFFVSDWRRNFEISLRM